MRPGEVLYREGDERCDFFVVLEGQVAMLEGTGDAAGVVAVHRPGRLLGELGLLTGQAAFLTAMAVERARCWPSSPTASASWWEAATPPGRRRPS
jgi:thioredoxin reductase (NADPH)